MTTGQQAQPVVLWGTGDHARVVANVVSLSAEWELAGFIDNEHPERHGQELCGQPVLGGLEQLDLLPGKGIDHVIPAFSTNHGRLELIALLTEKHFTVATAIHPSAVIAADAVIGQGTTVMAGAVVNPGAVIGNGVIINTGATVDHDCQIEDGAHICPGVHLAGHVTVGRAAWIGIGACVIQDISIGAEAFVGAGAAVVRDIPTGMLATGVPARIVREWKPA
jgi:sugar O-acyltransferase (sialic acid O-acetyltransferase NeuD family)